MYVVTLVVGSADRTPPSLQTKSSKGEFCQQEATANVMQYPYIHKSAAQWNKKRNL